MKYVVAASGFVLVWLVVAIVCGFVMEIIFWSPGDLAFGIGIDWIYVPGIILGLLAGIHSWRASIRMVGEAEARKQEKSARTGD